VISEFPLTTGAGFPSRREDLAGVDAVVRNWAKSLQIDRHARYQIDRDRD